MNRFKKILKRLLLIALILLAGVGVGLSGGVPIPNIGKRRDKSEINKESVESEATITTKASAELRG